MERIAIRRAWETIIEAWRGSIKREAMAEAIRLAHQDFLEHGKNLKITMIFCIVIHKLQGVTK